MADNAGFSVPPKLPVEVMMSPKKSAVKWTVESLLTVDGEDMVYRLSGNHSGATNQIIVVQNGSFLVNFAAIDSNKRALADQLIAEATSLTDNEYGLEDGFPPQILILESDGEFCFALSTFPFLDAPNAYRKNLRRRSETTLTQSQNNYPSPTAKSMLVGPSNNIKNPFRVPTKRSAEK